MIYSVDSEIESMSKAVDFYPLWVKFLGTIKQLPTDALKTALKL